MRCYEEAEFAAILLSRLALRERDPDAPWGSDEMLMLVGEFVEQYGDYGYQALIIALSRLNAASVAMIAEIRRQGASGVLDELGCRQKIEGLFGGYDWPGEGPR
jgi:hypothetical protein